MKGNSMKKLLLTFFVVIFLFPLVFAEGTYTEIKLSEKTINTLKEYMKKEVKLPAERAEGYSTRSKEGK